MLRSLVIALALLAAAAPAAAARDAEIFATDNTATITDPRDPRLDDPLFGFARRVTRIVEQGGGRPRGSQLLDGVFAAPELTFERSRRFAVDHVTTTELHDIAETIRRRFLQQSVLTFDHLNGADDDVDAVLLEVPGVSARALREGLQADEEAQQRLFGGSVTLDRRLLLVAALEDAGFARRFAKQIGGDLRRAETHLGDREFVEVATAGRARVEHRRLTITGTPEVDTLALRDTGRRLAIDFGDDGVVDFEVAHRRFHTLRIDLGDGDDQLVRNGTPAADRLHLAADELISVERIATSLGDGADRLEIDDLTASGTYRIETDLGPGADRAVIDTSHEDEQVSVSRLDGDVSVLGPAWVSFAAPEQADRLRVNARGGRDILSASTDAMTLTLDGGDGGGTILGGPGDDLLLGGDGFDDARGNGGDDVALLGGYFDRFMWFDGHGSDRVDGGESRDSLFFEASAAAETFTLEPDGTDARFTRDVGGIVMDLDGIEVIDSLAGSGSDLYRVRDLRGTDVIELNASFRSTTAFSGDGAADRVELVGTEGDDAVKVTGKKVVSGAATVTGLPVKLGVSFADVAHDTIAIDTLGGDDTVDSSGLAPDAIGLEVR